MTPDAGKRPKKKRRGAPRSRTGCQTCKRRHTRCDEKKPICGSCERLNLVCEPSDDNNWKIVHTDISDSQPVQDGPSLLEFFQSQKEYLEQYPVNTVENGTTIHGPAISPPISIHSEGTLSLTSETAFLLNTYVRTVATWMDIFDHSSTYQVQVPQLMLTSSLLFHCVCAFTANHLSLSDASCNPAWKLVAVKHYGEALRLLIEALSEPGHEHALTASMLLLSYEIHEAQRSEDYRRHFLGLSTLIRERHISAASEGTDRANFWIYVRHEIVLAMSTEKPLVIDPENWSVSWVENESRIDVLGNHVIWILARVVNLIFGVDGTSDRGKQLRLAILDELQIWRAGLSATFVGIPYGDGDDVGLRKVYFPVTAAAAAAFWYHITHILLYTEPVLQDESYIPLIQEQAMKVASIAISDFPAALKVFSSHGLFYAGKHVQGISRKARIWNALKDVEEQTGYSTRATVQLLQRLVEGDT